MKKIKKTVFFTMIFVSVMFFVTACASKKSAEFHPENNMPNAPAVSFPADSDDYSSSQEAPVVYEEQNDSVNNGKKSKEEKKKEKEEKKKAKEAEKEAKKEAKAAEKEKKAQAANDKKEIPERDDRVLTIPADVVQQEPESEAEPQPKEEEKSPSAQKEPPKSIALAPPDPKSEVASPEKKSAVPAKKNYTGWIDSSGHPINEKFGMVRFRVLPKKGWFNIGVMNDDSKTIPVLSTANEYTTTSFYLKAGNKIIKLNDDTSVQASAHRQPDGVRLQYDVDNVADVNIDFTVFSSVEGGLADSVQITATVYNKGRRKTDFALKIVLDTILGETDRHHFYTSDGNPVKNEVLFRSFDENKWFLSKNTKGAMQVIVSGGNATEPELVALANFSTLDIKTWEPDLLFSRSFDTVLSYNNSAIGINWPTRKIGVGKVYSETFYISVASDGDMPGAGELFQNEAMGKDDKKEEAENAGQEKTEENAALSVPDAFDKPTDFEVIRSEPENTKGDIPFVPEPQKTDSPKAAEDEFVVGVPETKLYEESDVPKPAPIRITEDQLSYEYIRGLINRINSLEEMDLTLNRAELIQLNAELDAILEVLRKR